MAIPKIISEEAINLAEVKEYMKKIKKRDEQLSFRAGKTEEYLDQFTLLKVSEAKELYDQLVALNLPRLREAHLHKIVDICPVTIEGLRTLFAGTPTSISQESGKKILDAIESVAPKKAKKEKEEEKK